MRRIVYAGAWFFTGDRLAKALLERARVLAHVGSAAAVLLPARTCFGESGEVRLVVGVWPFHLG
jgi:hypothetical protein